MSDELIRQNDEQNEVVTTNLEPRHQRFVHLYLTGEYKLPQIASLMNVHPNTVSNWLRKPEVINAIKKFQEEENQIVESHLKSLRMKAIKTMEELLDSPIDGIRFQAGKDILDRTGHKAIQQLKVDKTITTFEHKIKDLIDRTIDENDIIDITPEEYTEFTEEDNE